MKKTRLVRLRVQPDPSQITKNQRCSQGPHSTHKIVCCASQPSQTPIQNQPKTHMASSTFANAIDALVAERDHQFILRVAQDYNLNFEELNAKYLETAAMAIKVPRKYTKRAPKSVTVIEVTEGTVPAKAPKEPKAKQCCTAQTSKKEACKFSALKGEVFCKRHLKQSLGEAAEPSEPKAKKAPKAPKKGPEPVHTHVMDAEIHTDCELCESHGNPMATDIQQFEMVVPKAAFTAPHTGPIKVPSVDDRLAAMLADADESELEEDDDEFEVEPDVEPEDDGDLGEEEFEDEEDN